MNHLFRMLAAAAALFLTACLPVSTTSLVGTTAGLGSDPALIGMWHGEDEKDKPGYIIFFPEEDGTIKALVFAPPARNDKSGWDAYGVRTAAFGSRHYMNVEPIESNGKTVDSKVAKPNFPVLYTIDGKGGLTLWLIDEDAAKGAIKSGRIAGRIEPGDFGDVILTAAPAALDAFFASDAGRALFKKPFAALRRVP
jgi:hypothetical protein